MREICQELHAELDQLVALFRQAIDIGYSLVDKEEAEVISLVDMRQRICDRTAELVVRYRHKEEQHWISLSEGERAFLVEKKKILLDLRPKLQQQTMHTGCQLQKRTFSMRDELITHQKRASAIESYLRAPAVRPWLS